MNEFRSRRGWLPAFFAAAVLVAGTFGLQEVADRVYAGRPRPVGDTASLWDWLGQTYLGPFGPWSRSADTFTDQTALVAYGVVAFVISMAFSWRALRALAPGSGALPAWLSMWTAMVLGTVFGFFAHWVVADYDVVTGGAAAAPLLDTLATGCAYGVKWGWVPALVGTMVWVVVRPKPTLLDLDNDIVFDPDGTGYRGGDGGREDDESTRVLPPSRLTTAARREALHPDAPYR